MKYDPKSQLARIHLETVLCQTLEDAGFAQEFKEGTNEMIFSRPVRGERRVIVYTGCVENSGARASGKDAIRVCGLMSHNGVDRGLCKAKRVNRTGEIDNISERMLSRMREIWKHLATTPVRKCGCGAPKFLSKKENWVCADLCWSKK